MRELSLLQESELAFSRLGKPFYAATLLLRTGFSGAYCGLVDGCGIQ
jgi:hypothetical protein